MELSLKQTLASPFQSKYLILIALLSHLTGLIGFYIYLLVPIFIKLVPFHLGLMALLVFINHSHKDRSFYTFTAISTLCGYWIEVIGVKSGIIFGQYTYGNALGLKVFDVPLLIGINWALLIYIIGCMLTNFALSQSSKAFVGAVLLVALDMVIEQSASQFDYWSWQTGQIPLQNFIGWFVVSFCLLLFFFSFKFKIKEQISLAWSLYFMQFIFFIALLFY